MSVKSFKLQISSIVILVLIAIIFLQRCESKPEVIAPSKIDTVIKYKFIHDTVIGKPKFIKGKKDTLWIDSLVYVPDTSYSKLLSQYKDLGNKLFSTNIYRNVFSLGEYGSAISIDTVRANQLISASLLYNIKIPEKTITIIEQAPPKRQLYAGFGAYGSKRNIVDGMYIAGIYKDKQDRLTGVSVGYGGNQIQFGISSYWKIKLK